MQATFDLLKEMSDSGVGPTGDTFNTLMDAAIECGDPEAALRLFAQMVETGFAPDTVTFTTMIKVRAVTSGLIYSSLGRVYNEPCNTMWLGGGAFPAHLSILGTTTSELQRGIPMSGIARNMGTLKHPQPGQRPSTLDCPQSAQAAKCMAPRTQGEHHLLAHAAGVHPAGTYGGRHHDLQPDGVEP